MPRFEALTLKAILAVLSAYNNLMDWMITSYNNFMYCLLGGRAYAKKHDNRK